MRVLHLRVVRVALQPHGVAPSLKSSAICISLGHFHANLLDHFRSVSYSRIEITGTNFLQLGSITALIHGSFLSHCLMEILLQLTSESHEPSCSFSLDIARSIDIGTLGKGTA